jgi:hypothetical protein
LPFLSCSQEYAIGTSLEYLKSNPHIDAILRSCLLVTTRVFLFTPKS